MWKPKEPIVVDGRTLNAREAWWNEFADEYRKLCKSDIDHESLAVITLAIYAFNMDIDPRVAAEVAFREPSTEQWPGLH